MRLANLGHSYGCGVQLGQPVVGFVAAFPNSKILNVFTADEVTKRTIRLVYRQFNVPM